jgi:hypothetical protein
MAGFYLGPTGLKTDTYSWLCYTAQCHQTDASGWLGYGGHWPQIHMVRYSMAIYYMAGYSMAGYYMAGHYMAGLFFRAMPPKIDTFG